MNKLVAHPLIIRIIVSFVVFIIGSYNQIESVLGQTLNKISIAQTFTTNNSLLPTNAVRCVLTDTLNNHYLWAGTKMGLAGFDGQNWQVYTTQNSNLPDDDVRSLAINTNPVNSTTLWIGSFSGGLIRKTGKEWAVLNTSNSNLPDNFIKTIAIDETSKFIWAGTTNGLACITPDDDNNNNYAIYNYFLNTPEVWLQNINAVWPLTGYNIWAATLNAGLICMEDSSFWALTTYNSTIPDNTLTDLYWQPQDKTLFFTTAFHGLVIYNLENGNLNEYNINNASLPSNELTAVYFLPPYTLLLGTAKHGLAVFDLQNFTCYQTLSTQQGLPGNTVYDMCRASSDTSFWVATDGGLALLYGANIATGNAPSDSFNFNKGGNSGQRINWAKYNGNQRKLEWSLPLAANQNASNYYNYTLWLIDTNGNIRLAQQFSGNKNNELVLPTHFTSGFYIVRLKYGTQTLVSKILVV
jgi:hypothetical protein